VCDVTTAHGEASLRRMLMRVPVALSLIDGDGRVEILNDRFVGLFGYTLEDVRGIEDWWQLAYPDPVYRQEAMANWQAAVGRTTQDGGDIAAVESRITCKNGSVKLIEASAVVLADGLVATFTDVTEQRRTQQTQNQLNRELRAIGSCNQALLRAEDERTLLDEICRIVRTEAGYPVACVAFAEHDADKTVRMVARAGLDDDYFTDARLTWADRDLGRGPIGTAIRTGEMVVVQDIVTDPRMAFWQERARQRGFRSAVALPLNDDRHETFGGLLIYSDRRNAITSDEIRLLEGLAADLAFGITMLRIRGRRREAMEKLAASEQLFRTLVENSPDPIASISTRRSESCFGRHRHRYSEQRQPRSRH
jgi:PAS domain S-box-containing protein